MALSARDPANASSPSSAQSAARTPVRARAVAGATDVRRKMVMELRQLLGQCGFFISDVGPERNICFDLVARRDALLLLVKVLTNVDGFSPEAAHELRTLAHYMEACPLLVGTHSGAGELEDGVLYSRHHVSLVSPTTFRDQVQEATPPYMRSAPGGTFVDLIPEVLEAALREEDFTLGSISQATGVGRRTIQLYLKGMAATVDVALKLEELLNEEVIRAQQLFRTVEQNEPPFAPLTMLDRFARHLLRRMQQLGYNVTPTQRSPFTALAAASGLGPRLGDPQGPSLAVADGPLNAPSHKQLLLTMVVEDRIRRPQAQRLTQISQIMERDGVILAKESEKDSVAGTPVIRKKELADSEDSAEVQELIEERRG